MDLLEILQKQRPCILFLGQNYLSVDGQKDYFLSKLQQKTNQLDKNIDYNLLNKFIATAAFLLLFAQIIFVINCLVALIHFKYR